MSRRVFKWAWSQLRSSRAAASCGKPAAWEGIQVRQYWQDTRGYVHFETARPWYEHPHMKYYAAGITACGAYYYYNSRQEVPYTHRKHAIMFVSRDMEHKLGEHMFEQVLQEARAKRQLLPASHPYSLLVRKVGSRIAQVASDGHGGGYFEHMKNLDWEFVVINSPQVNAFVVPGGKVVVYTGLLDLLSREDELAAVVAHETGHVLARHHAERISSMNLYYLLQLLGSLLLGISLPDAAFMLGVFLPYSRRAEHEADVLGLRLMARACYDPDGCTTMLQKLHAVEQRAEREAGGRMPAFLRTHPVATDRVELVRKQLPAAYQEYQDGDCGVARDFLEGFEGVTDDGFDVVVPIVIR